MVILQTFLDLGVGLLGAGMTFIKNPDNLLISAPIGLSLMSMVVWKIRSMIG